MNPLDKLRYALEHEIRSINGSSGLSRLDHSETIYFYIAKFVLKAVFRIDILVSIYERCRIPGDSWNTLENILSYLKIDVHAKEIESKIPHSGATVVVSNHPTGIIDALALATAIRQVRNDIKIVGNHTLQAFEELDELVIPVDPVSPWDFNPINISQLRRAKRWLLQGHLLIVFPAGDVSHFRISKGAIADSDWNDTAIRLAESVDANFVQMFIKVPTDVITHYLGAIHWTFRTSIIIRRLKHWRGTVFRII